MPNLVDRRHLISTGLLGASTILAGCGRLNGSQPDTSEDSSKTQRGLAHVQIYNMTDESVRVSISALRLEDEKTRLNETVRIEPDDFHEFPACLWYGYDYDMTVDVENGPVETRTWKEASNSLYILIPDGLNAGNIVFAEMFG